MRGLGFDELLSNWRHFDLYHASLFLYFIYLLLLWLLATNEASLFRLLVLDYQIECLHPLVSDLPGLCIESERPLYCV